MASDLIQIGKSGAIAARSALEVTGQNIANASNPDYTRRTALMAEVVATGGVSNYSGSALSGVRVDQVQRSDSLFLQMEARRTNSDFSRADIELTGLTNAESAVEQAGIYPAIVEFEASLAKLQSDPLNESLRANVLENGRTLADTLHIADHSLDLAGDQLRFDAAAGVSSVNLALGELARINAAVVRTEPGTANQAALLDQRDAQLAKISNELGIAVQYDPSGAVTVRLGDGSGATLLSGVTPSTLGMTENTDGTLAFDVGGVTVNPTSGALAGRNQALAAQRDLGAQLDQLAATTISKVNAAQATGADPTGAAGQPFFSGSTAANIGIALTSGSGIATAPAGSPAGSRDISNLATLRDALAASDGPANQADEMLFQLSNAVASRKVTRDALSTIAQSAQVSLSAETGVDLDAEAANLMRFQQAFQASGRIIQVASDIFNTILGIR